MSPIIGPRGYPEVCLARRSGSNQSLSNATWTVIGFDDEDYDPLAMHDTVTNNSRITVPTGGVYELVAQLHYDNNSTGVRYCGFKLNGTSYFGINMAVPSGETDVVSVARRVLVAGDYVECVGHQTSGGSLNVMLQGSPSYSPVFSVARIA